MAYKDNYKSYKYNNLFDMLELVKSELSEGAYYMLRTMLVKKAYSKKYVCKVCKIYNYQFDNYMIEIQKVCKPFADLFN